MASPATPSSTGSPAGEMLVVSPVTPSRQDLSTSRKRKITPTSEASSPKRLAVVTSPGSVSHNSVPRSTYPNPLGWPALAAQAHVDARVTLFSKPLSRGDSTPKHSLTPRHIVLPFDLRKNPDAFYETGNRELISSIFPGNYGLSMDGMFLHFLQAEMPPKPWPVTVAGLPPVFAPKMGPQYTPRPMGFPVPRRNPTIARDISGRDMQDWTALFEEVKDYFVSVEIGITEVMYWQNYLIIVLEDRNTDLAKLPYDAGNISCSYLYDDEMGRPSLPQARRLMDPTPGNPDDSEYKALQPGLRLASPYLPEKPGMFLSTTSGVLVKDAIGNQYMTAAAHGLPPGCGGVALHPLPSSGRQVGKAVVEVTHTDIALVKLEEGEEFSNETFQYDEILESVQLKRLASARDHQTGDHVFLDSPDTGCVAGMFMSTSFQRIPADDHTFPKQQWVSTTWCYTGQDSGGTLPDSTCGSAIWTEEGDVIAFFRYAPTEGVMRDWCAGIASDELIKRGYTLVDTSSR